MTTDKQTRLPEMAQKSRKAERYFPITQSQSHGFTRNFSLVNGEISPIWAAATSALSISH